MKRVVALALACLLLFVEGADGHRVGRSSGQAVVKLGHGPDEALPALRKHLGLVHDHSLVAHVGEQVRIARVHDRDALQIVEALRIGARHISARAARTQTLAMLEAVQIRDPERVFDLYPHELSSGMGQRVMIAMMVVREPDLLIADEPTSALDVTVQGQVLSIMDELVTRRGMGLILISHDLNLVSRFCDRVLVMYAGRVVEEIRARDLHAAQHPYTRGLMACLPSIDGPQEPLPVLDRQAAWAED